MLPRVVRICLIVVALVVSIPTHEFGHHYVAKMDGAEVLQVNYFVSYNGSCIIWPSITVNEFTFSSSAMLILYYLSGLLITFVPGLLVTVILYPMEICLWRYAYVWVISAPLISITDIDRVFELMGLSDIAKWMHVGLGAGTVLMLWFMGRRMRR